MTNGTLREDTRSDSATDNDEIVLLFNLNRLNEDCPNWVLRDAWNRGQIPNLPEPIIENLVHRVDRNRCRFEKGNSSDGPQIRSSQVVGQDGSWTQYLAEPEAQMETAHNHIVNLDTGVTNIVNAEIDNLSPSPPSPVSIASDPRQSSTLHCEEWLEGSQIPPKKRLRSEFG